MPIIAHKRLEEFDTSDDPSFNKEPLRDNSGCKKVGESSHGMVFERILFSKGMARVRWQMKRHGSEKETVIELKHGVFSGRRHIQINGETVLHKRKFFDSGSRYDFEVDDEERAIQACVVIRVFGVCFLYDLFVDGVKVDFDQIIRI